MPFLRIWFLELTPVLPLSVVKVCCSAIMTLVYVVAIFNKDTKIKYHRRKEILRRYLLDIEYISISRISKDIAIYEKFGFIGSLTAIDNNSHINVTLMQITILLLAQQYNITRHSIASRFCANISLKLTPPSYQQWHWQGMIHLLEINSYFNFAWSWN